MERELLIEVFGKRPSRLEILSAGLEKIKLGEDAQILETGCSFGDGVSFVCEKTGGRGFAVDIEEKYIDKAIDTHPHIEFQCASVYELPYQDSTFDLVFSQASFSLLKEKEKAIKEYYRVLKNSGHILINDFIVKDAIDDKIKSNMNFIPCFNSIGTLFEYIRLFESNSFHTIAAEEMYKEIIDTTLYLAKYYKCTPKEMTSIFASILGTDDSAEEKCHCFFESSKVSFAQFIFAKKGKGCINF